MALAYSVKANLIQQYTKNRAGWQNLAASMVQPQLTRLDYYWSTALGSLPATVKPLLFKDFYFEAWVSPHAMAVDSFQEMLLEAVKYEVQGQLIWQSQTQNNPVKYIQEPDLQQMLMIPGGNLLMTEDMLRLHPYARLQHPFHFKSGTRDVSTLEHFPSGMVLEFKNAGRVHFDQLDIVVLSIIPQGTGEAACLQAHLRWELEGTFDVQQYQVGTKVKKDAAEEPTTTPDVDLEAQKKQWIKDGCCPECGQCGRLDPAGGAMCSKHGFYQMEII
jgi:hypothetical protein